MAQTNKTVVAIGKFDGVHTGHKKLLKTASELAKGAGFVSVAFVIANDKSSGLMLPLDREQTIKNIGIDKVIVQNLTSDFMNMSDESFVKDILLKQLNCAHVVVGYNFRFAKGRSADAADLKELCAKYGIDCTIIPEVVCEISNDKSISASSSNIKQSLLNGDVKTASAILGRRYFVSGEVVQGKQLGRTINTPTANVKIAKKIVLPQNGVYSANVYVDGKKYLSVTNIGDNPTVNNDGNITVESFILDFHKDIYGKDIVIEFIDKIRDEKKFSSLEELKEQIQKDVETALLTK
ncbi:MAG: bifunctional riboflavin kinase/FAD synthetase [Clostridia bacterium]|nr:bifunctional riboflavin kinase/FAD synthetase [Clostridia bacterium]